METLLIYAAIALVVIVGGGYLALRAWAASAPQPGSLGVDANGLFAPCPDTPNCVTTQQGLPSQTMPALTYTGSRDDAQTRMRTILAGLPRTQLVTDKPGYLHVEFRSALVGYIDDVQFAFDDAAKTIHFKSAARLGMGDMGVNRARMTEITSLWNK